jgi:hypothetical protein
MRHINLQIHILASRVGQFKNRLVGRQALPNKSLHMPPCVSVTPLAAATGAPDTWRM